MEHEAPRASPTVDGVITEVERDSQRAIPMSWPGIVTPPQRGALLLGAPPAENELSGISYVSWDDDFIYFAAEVFDDTPAFLIDSRGTGNVPYNAQDLWQPCFNPHADPFNLFIDPNGPPGSAAIYDVVVDTSDGFGPDVYRHGPRLSAEQHADIEVDGEVTDDGYTLEIAVPWSAAMDDPGYVPEAGDVHGVGFILVSFGGANSPVLFTDFGSGDNVSNTIGDPTTWNRLTLADSEPPTRFVRGDTNADSSVDITDAVFVLNFLFLGGDNPPCRDAANVDDSPAIDITDGIYVLNFLFLGGAAPPSPFPDCSGDGVGEDADCGDFQPCE